ncbi:MAG: hypothetical protein IKO20_06895 [Bacteroidaceae bacterium]|nr:hypothetical protein [Bacteroidaceae bacterium]
MKRLHHAIKQIICLLCCCAALSACHYSYPVSESGEDIDSIGGIDSTGFLLTHHYWRGDVFITSDSLRLYVIDSPVRLQQQSGEADELMTTEIVEPDTIVTAKGIKLFVTDLINAPDSTADSTWVYLTSTEGFHGWVKEVELLSKAAPDDPISSYIHTFSRWHTPLNIAGIIGALCVLAYFCYRKKQFEWVLLLHGSPYPILLRMCVSLCALLYAMVWYFAPHTWTEYYFNPTLNPFAHGLPPVLSIFLASAWLLALMAIAVLDDVWRRLPGNEAICFVIELLARCILVSIAFSLSTNYIYVGCMMLAAYWMLLLYTIWKANKGRRFYCGHCGRAISKVPGKCPYCGFKNEEPAKASKNPSKTNKQ